MAGIEYFSKNAESYARSESHAKGEDLTLLMNHLPHSPLSVSLDIATGTGFTALKLAEQSSIVIALDKTVEMMDQARELASKNDVNNLIFVRGDSMDLPFMDNSFEIVTCRRAAHHFQDKLTFLQEVTRVLKPGGYFALADMIAPTDNSTDKFNLLERIRDTSHVSAGTARFWESSIGESGLKVEFKQVLEEKVVIEKWLNPTKVESEEGHACIDFLRANAEYFSKYQGYDGTSMIKRRMVIVTRKPE